MSSEKQEMRLSQSEKDEIGSLINRLMDNRSDYSNARPLTAPVEKSNVVGNLTLTNDLPKGRPSVEDPSVVVVDKTNHKTHVLQMRQDGRVEAVLTVKNSTGKLSSWTPEGRHEIVNKREDPIWYPPPRKDGKPAHKPELPFRPTAKHPEGNPHNPIGYAFIRTSAGGQLIGLHGTNRPDQLGKDVSHGCVRHDNDDILKIYPLVDKGTPVYIVPKFDRTQIKYSDFKRKH